MQLKTGIIIILSVVLVRSSVAGTADVVLYGEALCPYTVGAINDVIGPLLDGDLREHFGFRYVAWGNARNTSGGVVCQHGPSECRLNKVISCAWELGRGAAAAGAGVSFLRCLSQRGVQGAEAAVAPCAERAGLRPEDIKACVEGQLGDQLERAAAEETAGLHPPHTYVPWVTMNGVPLGEDLDNLRKYICVGVKPEDRPEACYAPPDAVLSASAGVLSTLRKDGDRRVIGDGEVDRGQGRWTEVA